MTRSDEDCHPASAQARLTERLDANLGYNCNNDCVFCYFRDRKNLSEPLPTEDAMRLLKSIRGAGIKDVELTGGEVTLHPDITRLITYAKRKLGFRSVTVITNGSRMCDRGFTQKLADAGLDDALVSVHGPDAGTHDALTRRKGSFDEAVAAIGNALDCGLTGRSNTVVTGNNYEAARDIAGLVASLGVDNANFIHFSPLDDADMADDSMMPRYSDTSACMKRMIDAHGGSIGELSVKVIPFCFMTGYESHVIDLYQNNYDPHEWDYYARVKIRRGRALALLAATAGAAAYLGPDGIRRLGWSRALREGIVRAEARRHCVKGEACSECRFDGICPGVWKAYARKHGLDELKPASGERITDSAHYIRGV